MKVNVCSEYGKLNAVLLHRPGPEIERMTPTNASEALYSDILNLPIVEKEYDNFCGVLEKWTKVYYVTDILAELLTENDTCERLVRDACKADGCDELAESLMQHDPRLLARELVEGVENPLWRTNSREDRYLLQPLYNLFFTRDASSSVYDRVLINSMSFDVRRRESLLYKAIFTQYFGSDTLYARDWNDRARTEGGDVQIANPNLLCIGDGIRTNSKGVDYLISTFAKERPHFKIIAQELPYKPESFIHLDMVFTFLSSHECMCYEPMLKKTGVFAGKDTTLINIDEGRVTTRQCDNILEALKLAGMEMKPILCGGSDPWDQEREQWHSGANFFCLGDGKVLGYARNRNTIEALDQAGFSILDAEQIANGKVDMHQYEKFVATFQASELPRGGGGARCMTMPINRD